MHSSAPYAFSRGPGPNTKPPAPQRHPAAPPAHPKKPYYKPLPMKPAAAAAPPAPAAPAPAAADAPMQQEGGAGAGSGSWTAEQLAEARATATDLFDAPLNESGKHRVRVTVFGNTVGIDVRDFFLGQYGELKDKWLPGKKGIRLRPEEWEALKAVSGDVDAALQQAGWVPQPVAPVQ